MAQNNVLLKARKKKAKALAQSGHLDEARALCVQLCKTAGRDAEPWFLLGAIDGQLGHYDGAIESCLQAIAREPGHVDAHYNLAQAYLHRGRPEAAAAEFRRVVELSPDHVEAHANLGFALELLGDYEGSLASSRRALALRSDHVGAWINLGNALGAIGDQREAQEAFRSALRVDPDDIKARVNLGFSLYSQGALEDALSQFERVRSQEPDNTDAAVGVAAVHEKRGEFEKARALLDPLAARGHAELRFAMVYAGVARHFDRRADAIALLERVLTEEPLEPADQATLNYRLGKLHDELGHHDEAFACFQAANAHQARFARPDRHLEIMTRSTAWFTPQALARTAHATHRSEQPVFIVGMPRSGTTLVEQILSSHPRVYGGGESTGIAELAERLPRQIPPARPYPECLESLSGDVADAAARRYLAELAAPAPDAARITDKMPHNFLYLGLIELLFPGARVIHCRRNPLDTCLSIFTYPFNAVHAYATSLARLGEHYRHYQGLMAHWQAVLSIPLFEIQYEDLVAEPERLSRALVEFCGLEWDPRCLRFHENERVINTFSYDQVRRPIYRGSVERWRRYERHLAPLAEALGIEA